MADIRSNVEIRAVDPSIAVGQSIGGPGPAQNLPNIDAGSQSPPGPNPAQKLNGTNPASIVDLIRYPSDTPPYFFQLPINAYHRDSWVSVGQLHEEHRIILPLPQQMIDNMNIRYEISDIGFAGAAGFNALAGDGGNAIAQAAAAVALTSAQAGFGNSNLAKGARGAIGAAGVAVNDFMTIMLRGPDYKKRDFIWKFSPKSAQETSDLKRIIQLINNSASPSLFGFGSAFFSWPKIFTPEFVYNDQKDLLALNTFRMKPSVITDFSVNYTPGGNFSPFAATKAPSSVEMRISFLELEFWLNGQFSDVPATTPGTSTSSVLNNILGTEGGLAKVFKDPSAAFRGVGTTAVSP